MAVTIKKSNPLYNFTVGFIGIICASVVWCFYSVAIELLPMQSDFTSCKAYSADYIWNRTEDDKCIKYLDTLQYYGTFPSTFWSILILSGLMPWKIICMVAIITSHDKTDTKTKQYSWIFLVLMMSAYFLTLLLSAWYGIQVYLYATPAFIGIPSMIGVPVYTYTMMILNVCKPYLELINPLTIVTYILIVSSIMVLASYIIWLPDSYNDRRYKAGIMLSCAYFFAWLAAVILSLQVHLMYMFDGYKKPERPYVADDNAVEQREEQRAEQTVEKPIEIPKYLNLGTGLSFMMNSVLVSWLSITTSSANITILVLISIFPIMCRIAVLGQNALYVLIY